MTKAQYHMKRALWSDTKRLRAPGVKNYPMSCAMLDGRAPMYTRAGIGRDKRVSRTQLAPGVSLIVHALTSMTLVRNPVSKSWVRRPDFYGR